MILKKIFGYVKKFSKFSVVFLLIVTFGFADVATVVFDGLGAPKLAQWTAIKKAEAVAQGDGEIIYGDSNASLVRRRDWTGTFSVEYDTLAAGTVIRHVVIKASPVRNEMIAGIQTTAGTLYIQRFNGTSWSNEWNVTVGDGNLPRFDISFEGTSGDMMVVYTGNTATDGQELVYRIWNGSTWTVAANLGSTRTTGIVDGIAMERRGGTDEIALVYGDRNFDLSANFWDGATNAWKGEPSAALETSLAKVGTATTLTNFSFDLEFESTSGELLIVWGADAVLDGKYVTRGAGPAGAWGSVTTNTAFLEEPTDVELSADPNSNYIAYANSSDNGADSDAIVWTGTAWGTAFQVDASNDTVGAGTSNNAVNWVTSGAQTRAVLTYDDANAAGVDWAVYNKNTNAWALQTDCTTACSSQPLSGDDKVHRLRRNPFNQAELLFLGVDNTSDLWVKKLVFDGTNFTWSNADGGVALETVISSVTGFAADFAYNRYIPPTVTTTLATGSDPAAATIAPEAVTTDVNQFTLQTSSGTETVTSVTVNLSTGSGVDSLYITDNTNTVLGSIIAPLSGGSNVVAVSGMSAGTSATTFKVRVTPLPHSLMPAVTGAAYAITAPVTAWAGNATTHAGSDTNTNALTIDNASPSGATSASGTAGDAKVTLNWTTSASTDFSRSVMLRWTASTPSAAVPEEGTDYANGNTVGSGSKIDYNTGASPIGVAFDSSTNSVWVVNSGGNTVTKLTAATGALVGTYTVGNAPRDVAFDSSTNSVWVTNTGGGSGNTVTKLTAATGALVGTYTVGTGPFGVAFDSSTNSVWVANNGSGSGNTVTKLTAATGALVGTYTVGTGPFGVAFDSSTNSVWVANNGSGSGNTVTKLTAATGALVGTYTVGTGPFGVAFDSSTNSVWVANNGSGSGNTVTKLTAATGALVGTYTVGTGPRDIAFDSSTNSVWVVNNGGNTVTKLTAATGALVGTYTVGTGPIDVAFDSTTNSVWVVNNGDDTVTKLTAATGALVGTYAVGVSPISVAFDSSTNSVWVVNNVGETVSKVDAVGATVVCVRTDAASTAITDINGAGGTSCLTTALTNGTAYSYKVFQKDANGNYDAGVVPTGSPFTPAAITTTLATGSDPAAATIAPGAVATDVDLFTLQTSSGTETVTSVTVNLSTNSGIGLLAITDNANTVLGSTASPVTGSNVITVSGMSAGTTLTTFKVRATPLSHALMPAPAGGAYAITAPVTSWAGANTHAGSDTNSNALTIDNGSPAGTTGAGAVAGNAQVTVSWTNPADADFQKVIIYCKTASITETPTEGSDPTVDVAACDATARVKYNGSISPQIITGLTNGTLYYFRIYARDTNGNFTAIASTQQVSATPAAGGGLPVSGTLTSGVFDTGTADGATFNSILWNGTTIGTGAVRFQFSASNSSTGPWDYNGAGSGTCGALDWFNPGALDTAVELKGSGCAALWNNKRYYRYKVQICSAANCTDVGATSPIINKIVVSWSP